MRLKKIRNAYEYISNTEFFVKEPKKLRGNYKTLFDNNNEIHLEIGTGKGDFIINKALQNPNINFIGFEKYDSVLVKAIRKIEDEKIPNLKIINDDANFIEDIFDKEITTLYLNFSDPWPKNRHSKRRLSSKEFLERYENIFKGDSHIVMKTDNRLLFEFSLKEFTDFGYKIEDISLDLHKSDYKDNIMTEYETKFSSKGFPIYMVDIRK